MRVTPSSVFILVVVMAALLQVGASASVRAGSDHGGNAKRLDATVLSSRSTDLRVPRNMASFSVEVMSPLRMIIVDAHTGAVRASYLEMLNFLGGVASPDGGIAGQRLGPNLRIGGNSADETWYAPNATGVQPPFGKGYVVSATDIAAFAHVKAWGGTLTVDLSLRNATDPDNAMAYAAAVHTALSADDIMNFEIGNEPELFVRNGYRADPFTFWDWEGQWALYAHALVHDVLAGAAHMIQGAVFCCGMWNGYLPAYVANYTQSLSTISHHFYPMSGASATIEKLLAPHAVDLFQFRDLAHACNDQGVPFVIGEGNSAYDGGKKGVSDAFASTLWGLDLLFEAARNGIRRFNFHGGPGGAYTPIDTEQFSYAYARPLFYAMWAFTDATSADAALLQVNYNNTNEENVKVWATSHVNRTTVVVIHKRPWDLGGEKVLVNLDVSAVAKAGDHVHVRVLTAPAINATSGLTFGGLTFDGSSTGRPQGTPVVHTRLVDAGGRLQLHLDPLHALVADFFPASA